MKDNGKMVEAINVAQQVIDKYCRTSTDWLERAEKEVSECGNKDVVTMIQWLFVQPFK